ncbi:MAG: recJ [Candidatus Nomurabacteria bacterium]|nr:recJ [Candidatus Nomurabacteria bacterium]
MSQFKVASEYSNEELKKMFDGLDVHPLTLGLLANRGVKTKEDAEKFLNPSYERDIGDPFLIHGVKKAVERIVKAIENEEKIAIYSDYDCDGIPGGVLLRTFFDDIGYPVQMYIPHRHNEGYGVHNHAIDSLKEKGVTLVITVDLAITNIDEVAYARDMGIDFIVTDHHLPITKIGAKDKKLGTINTVQIVPDAVAVINSKQDVCTYHDDMLCGCAVAWKLSCAILSKLKEENGKKKISKGYKEVLDKVQVLKPGYEKWLLDLVGISTISDMVPLVKENRALAYFGLKVIRQTKRHGLNYILRSQGVDRDHITEDDIAFTIAPRINAASRMGDPIQAHNMLYEKNSITAQKYTEDLEILNTERKQGVKDIISTLLFDHEVYTNDIVVVGDISWGPGILGLIAQNIIDETGKPTFVYGQGEDKKTIKGSCRSRGDVHVVELMAKAHEMHPEVVVSYGGHEQAGGFESTMENVGELSRVLNEAIKHIVVKILENESLLVDSHLQLSDVNMVTYNAISRLAPFGVGNPKPLFSFEKVVPKEVRWFGKKNEHLEVMYPGEKNNVKAILFFAPKELAEKVKKEHTLLAHVEKSAFRGKIELRLRIKEVV